MGAVLLVGAGFSGAVSGRELAEIGCRVTVLGQRPHLGMDVTVREALNTAQGFLDSVCRGGLVPAFFLPICFNADCAGV